MSRNIYAADLFCGAGGTSTGLAQACKMVAADPRLLAINCWPKAIASHQDNHPWAKHLCARLEAVVPEQAIREHLETERLTLLLASPECIFHSNARGGKPINDQLRASAWVVPRWVESTMPESVIIENVPEFANWGPVDDKGQRIKERAGETFKAYIGAIQSFGYTVDSKVLNSADFGDPTSRRRLFVMARRGDKPIVWPKQTHSQVDKKTGKPKVKGTLPWRSAREIIDFTIPSQSIFGRSRPLSDKTLQRIVKGLKKFSGPELQPFLVKLYGTSDASDVDDPAPTVTGGGGHLGLAEPKPFTLSMASGGEPRDVDEPLPTIVAKGGGFVAEPFIVPNFGERDGQEARTHGVDEPLPTVTGRGAGNLVEPFIIPPDGPGGNGSGNGPKSIDDPLNTIRASRGGGHLVEPFIITTDRPDTNRTPPKDLTEPLPTITGNPRIGVVDGFILDAYGSKDVWDARTKSLDEPLPTATGSPRFGVVEPYLVEYYGTGGAKSVDDPVPTIPTKGRFGVAEPFIMASGGPRGQMEPSDIDAPLKTVIGNSRLGLVEPILLPDGRRLDIRFRMLQPKELAGAQGFPKDYRFAGSKTDAIKQIGNAVTVNMAKALVMAALGAPDSAGLGRFT